MDYSFDEKYKPKQDFTPARRWSYLVGAGEKSHTAQSRLVKILAESDHAPTLTDLEEAFNIEKVTTEFFREYRDLFIRTKEALDVIVRDDPKVKADFNAKGVNTVDFAKKLLGQIVFLYFLQKKGWFGVGRDADWGTGSKHFLRELFEKKHGDYKNFFNDILEPLFYEALRRPRDDYYYRYFNCKIPFLNGGLFDPIGNYDWVHTDINLPDILFSNRKKTKKGDEGDGILDIFDRYNFTVKEDEPLEKEVAIDPELLGKAYEKFNAIRPDNFEEYKKALKSGKKGDETRFNKQFGVYYTPREIVHYMCRESLISHLATELNGEAIGYERLSDGDLNLFGNEAKRGQLDLTAPLGEGLKISRENIEALIHTGEQLDENEQIALVKARRSSEGKQKGSKYTARLPESIRSHAELIDKKLEEITVCDPAVGSGAFPVGMMSEIVKTRLALNKYLADKDERTPYRFKRRCIEHSLYGVDIDSGAVEIAKLRLWLSLVVDEEDITTIRPLPNLDYKIVCGDSLLGYPYKPMGLEKIEKMKDAFLEEVNPTKKNQLRDQIDDAIYGLFQDTDKSLGYNVTMDFKINFSEVFRSRHGFDVVIANPPYVNSGKIKELKPSLKSAYGNFYCGTADLYTYFIQKGLTLTSPYGLLCYITSNKYMRAGYGKNTRELLTRKASPVMIIDFGELPVFEAATDPSIMMVSGIVKSKGDFTAITIKNEEEIPHITQVVRERGFSMPISDLSLEGWILENRAVLQLKEKLKKKGIPLGDYVQGQIYRGILTGFNKAFIIAEETKDRLIAEDKKSEELIKPWLDGHEIQRWSPDWSGQYLIKIESSANVAWPWSAAKKEKDALSIFRKQYPALYKHLIEYEAKLKAREDQGAFWWELRSCSYYDAFQKNKILYNETSKELHAFIDRDGFYVNKTGFVMLSGDIEYLLGILNSKMLDWYYRVDFPMYGDPWKGGRIQFRKDPNMLGVPIVLATPEQAASIVERVKRILSNPKVSHAQHLEAEIDRLVYDLYGLTKDEIRIVEDGIGNATS